MSHLVHLLDKSIDVLLSVTKITTLNVVLEFPASEATSWVAQLEWPQEIASLLEVGTNSEDLVDQILHTHNAVLAQVVLNKLIVGKSNTLLVDLAISSLIDELSDRLEVGVAVGDERVDDCKHLLSGLGQTDKDTIVDLEESEKLEDLAWLGSDLVDTLDSNDEDEFVLLFDVEGAILTGETG